MTDPDARDWAKILDGDTAALGALFERHAPRLFRHAARFVSVREDAKDAVVVAMYELWRKRRSVRLVDGSPLPWLLTTVTNTARNLERSGRRYRSLVERVEPSVTLPDVTAIDDDSGLREALQRLTERERDVVVLTLVEGLSERDTATALGIPVGTVKSRLARARTRLRSDLTHLQEA